jgi:hypothetical protein
MNLDWDKIAAGASDFIKTAAPIAETLEPEAAAGIEIGSKVLQGLLAAEPSAKALVTQVTSGTPLTAAQVRDYYATYKRDDDALAADIAEHLAALGKLGS